ncbi:MAG: hypothetical protein N2738_09450, partial [Thermodesulfovibrionales bacterium]|nr:hypothetical protein [Thermodesulfovibrionales bacterium]
MKKIINNKFIITSFLFLLIVPFFLYLFLPIIIRHISGFQIHYESINPTTMAIRGLHVYNQDIDLRASKVSITNPIAIFSSQYDTDILINEPNIILTSTPDKKSDIDFLKRLPKIKNLTIEKGTVLYSQQDLPYELKINNLRVFIKDYEPNKGGSVNYDFSFNVKDKINKQTLSKGEIQGKALISLKDISLKGD